MILLAVAAAAPAPIIACGDSATQIEMNACAAREYETADAALNAQWNEVAAKWKATDEAARPNDGRRGYFAQLLAGQRAWLNYRDAHCATQGYLARGGSLEPLLVTTCKTDLTRKRTEELRELGDWGD